LLDKAILTSNLNATRRKRGNCTVVDQIVLMADLSAHLEVFYSSEGHAVATFNLAFRVSKKKTGSINIAAGEEVPGFRRLKNG